MTNDQHHEHHSIRAAYQEHGVESFYQAYGESYRNPHEHAIRCVLRHAVAEWPLDLAHVLDLACGSGEVTLALRDERAAQIDGMDPYTYHAYEQRTGQPAERFGFEDIAAGQLAERAYSLVVCSFALHLVEPSRLPLLCYWLAQACPALLVLTPHKRPVLRPEWGWLLTHEVVIERVRARLYARAEHDTEEMTC